MSVLLGISGGIEVWLCGSDTLVMNGTVMKHNVYDDNGLHMYSKAEQLATSQK